MEQYKTNVAIVMAFLRTNDFSASVISQHKLCYQELQQYLLDEKLDYSYETACQWTASHEKDWKYRKYTGYKHCIDQLDDVFHFNAISPDHLSPRTSAYGLLNDDYKSILNDFISEAASEDDRYRIACSRFLLYLQNSGLKSISELTYDLLLKFHSDDYHRSSRSKDTYEDLIRSFLRHLATQGICDIGLSFALNKLLIPKIMRFPDEVINRLSGNASECYMISWGIISDFLFKMNEARYGKTVLKCSKHVLTLLYIFLEMHNTTMNKKLLWYWFDNIKPALGSSWKQYRRTLCQFLEYLTNGMIVTAVIGNPNSVKAIDLLQKWESEPLKAYLELLEREGWRPSTIAMQRSSNIRFCKYLQKMGISSFADISKTTLKDFNLQDIHSTPEGKAAYNCRIRSFLIYLYEQGMVTDPYLYRVLPTIALHRTTLVQTLSKEEVATIWAVDPNSLEPKALRDYAMVCIGLTMGFRASDISSLRFENINWKEKSIRIVQQKTGKMLTMPMPVKTGNILFRYIRDGRPHSSEPFIFIRHEAPYDRIQRGVCRSALKRFLSIPKDGGCSFHSIRKTFATQLLNGNTKVELISDSLGHSTDDTVHKYLSLDEKKIRLCALSMAEAGISYKGGAFNA